MQGHIRGFMHLDNGQETIPAMVADTLTKKDIKYSYYRDHTHALASGKLLMIYIWNFHVLNHLLLIYMCKLHWNLNTMFLCQVNYFWFTYEISMF